MFRGRPARRGWARLRETIQDWACGPDEQWARERGYQARRDPNGCGVTIRDPRWDTRSECDACAGEGTVGASECAECDGTGVIITGGEQS